MAAKMTTNYVLHKNPYVKTQELKISLNMLKNKLYYTTEKAFIFPGKLKKIIALKTTKLCGFEISFNY